MASERNTFLGVAACDLALPVPLTLGEADVVIFGAADATPHLKGRSSHAANGPTAIRNALRVYQTDLSRWDFDQDGILLDREQIRVVDGGDRGTAPNAVTTSRRGTSQGRETVRLAKRLVGTSRMQRTGGLFFAFLLSCCGSPPQN
jgi:agmatinase